MVSMKTSVRVSVLSEVMPEQSRSLLLEFDHREDLVAFTSWFELEGRESFLESKDKHSGNDLVEKESVPKLSGPCPHGRDGRHSIYFNAGPGGKRHKVAGWQCCENCGANGPIEVK